MTKTPFIGYGERANELLALVYNFQPSQILSEVLRKAPRLWGTVLNPRNYTTLAQFQTAIKYHEELLIEFGERYEKGLQSSSKQYRSYRVDVKPSRKPNVKKEVKNRPTRSYAIGWNNPQHSPPHPKDDSNISKGKTPADYGARGCIFCGSTKHWDRDCKHFKDGSTYKARTMFTDCSPDDMHAEAEYERCYLESREEYSSEESSSEESDTQETDAHEAKETSDESQQDF